MMRIEVKKQIDLETNEVWTFNLFDLNAVFIAWHKEIKPKGKRTWKIVAFWDNYARREYSMLEEPILPEEIKKDVLAEIAKRIKVNTWAEWKRR